MSTNGKQHTACAQTSTVRKLSLTDMKVVRRVDQQADPSTKVAQNKQNKQNYQNN